MVMVSSQFTDKSSAQRGDFKCMGRICFVELSNPHFVPTHPGVGVLKD